MKKHNSFFIILGILFCLNILAWITVFDLSKPKFLEVTFFDVGQGDAIFIETPIGHQILIDGGPDAKVLEKLGENMPFWDRSIDLIILTHPDRDHLRGLIEVLKKYEIDHILWTGIIKDTAEYKEWKDLIEREKAKIFIANSGQRIKSKKILIKILFPFENLEGQEFKRVNDTSIVTKMIFNQNSFLFTGDISKSIEKRLVEKEIEIDSDILKVAHHGSKTSTCEEFLEKVLPELAIVQVGENKYGHPDPEVLERLNFFDIKTLRTDLAGDIKIISDGTKFQYETAISNFQNKN